MSFNRICSPIIIRAMYLRIYAIKGPIKIKMLQKNVSEKCILHDDATCTFVIHNMYYIIMATL